MIAGALGGGAVAFTLMACYGAPCGGDSCDGAPEDDASSGDSSTRDITAPDVSVGPRDAGTDAVDSESDASLDAATDV